MTDLLALLKEAREWFGAVHKSDVALLEFVNRLDAAIASLEAVTVWHTIPIEGGEARIKPGPGPEDFTIEGYLPKPEAAPERSAVNELTERLKLIRKVLKDPYPDDVSAVRQLAELIEELETAPERKCATCYFWIRHMHFEVGDCQSGAAAEHATVDRTHEDFGCRFWQPREVRDE